MSVHFDELDQFFIEIERDAIDEVITDKIVRTVRRYRPSRNGTGGLHASTVIGYYARGHLVQIDIERDEIHKDDADTWPAVPQADMDRIAIEDFCDQHGLDLRSGSFQ